MSPGSLEVPTQGLRVQCPAEPTGTAGTAGEGFYGKRLCCLPGPPVPGQGWFIPPPCGPIPGAFSRAVTHPWVTPRGVQRSQSSPTALWGESGHSWAGKVPEPTGFPHRHLWRGDKLAGVVSLVLSVQAWQRRAHQCSCSGQGQAGKPLGGPCSTSQHLPLLPRRTAQPWECGKSNPSNSLRFWAAASGPDLCVPGWILCQGCAAQCPSPSHNLCRLFQQNQLFGLSGGEGQARGWVSTALVLWPEPDPDFGDTGVPCLVGTVPMGISVLCPRAAPPGGFWGALGVSPGLSPGLCCTGRCPPSR